MENLSKMGKSAGSVYTPEERIELGTDLVL